MSVAYAAPGRSEVPPLLVRRGPWLDPKNATGAVTRWETNGGELSGYAGAGCDWLAVAGVAAFRFERAGPVVAYPAGASRTQIDDVWTRSILPLVLQARGTQVLHASAVMTDGAVTALCGRSTAGKSTLAHLLGRRGHRVVADDVLPFAFDRGVAVAAPVPFRLRLRPEPAAYLSEDEFPPHRGASRAAVPLAQVVLLEPDMTGPPRITIAQPAQSLGALMPHAYCYDLARSKVALVGAYADLVHSVPVATVSFPREIGLVDDLADLLEELIAAR